MATKDPTTCMICLQENASLVTLPCKCRQLAHAKCWSEYSMKKGYQECLICHTQVRYSVEPHPPSFRGCALCCCCCFLGQFLLQFLSD